MTQVAWTAHPEVWVLLLGTLVLGWYTARVLEPKAVALGHRPISRRQRLWFVLGFFGIWIASDWPMHDIAEDYLYSVHMLQHMLLSMLIPAAFVLATPRWLFDILMPEGSLPRRWLSIAARPLVAGLVFNALTMILHWSRVVQISADSGPVHFAFHLLIFMSGLLMWMPVVGPIEEWRLSPPAACIYLFMMSVVPTVPGGWLVFAEDVVYRHYDTPYRLWGVDVLSDQQAAGAIMKLLGGFFLWGVITVIFGRWAKRDLAEGAARQREIDLARIEAYEARLALESDDSTLTYSDVTRAFSDTVAPPEPSR